MRLLLDTHLLLWLADTPERVPRQTMSMLEDRRNEILFSAVNIWEIAIKFALGKSSFRTDPTLVLRHAVAAGLDELPVSANHAIALRDLPLLHGDPFDRLLLAQAIAEDTALLTADKAMFQYDAPLIRV